MGKAKHKPRAVKAEKKEAQSNKGSASSGWKPWSLSDYGLRVQTVKADGNCFFRAVADQIEGATGDHMGFRQNTVSFMRQHREDFQPFMEDEEDFDRYCSRMAQDGTWAGQQEQVALARHYGVMIRVYQANQPAWTIKPDLVPNDAPTIHISYHDGEHYNSVRLASETGSGPPKPIAVQERPALAKDWTSFGPAQAELVMQGTGCYDDKEAVQRALQDAKGNPDEAIELLVERLAAQALYDDDKHYAYSVLVTESADQAHLAAVSNPDLPVALPNCASDAREVHSPERQQSERLGFNGNTLQEEKHAAVQAASITPGQTHARTAALTSEHDRASLETLHNSASAMGKAACQNVQPKERKQQGTSHKSEQIGASQHEEKPARNKPCPCGSGQRYKKCCGPVLAAQKRRESQGLQSSAASEDQGPCMLQLYV